MGRGIAGIEGKHWMGDDKWWGIQSNVVKRNVTTSIPTTVNDTTSLDISKDLGDDGMP